MGLDEDLLAENLSPPLAGLPPPLAIMSLLPGRDCGGLNYFQALDLRSPSISCLARATLPVRHAHSAPRWVRQVPVVVADGLRSAKQHFALRHPLLPAAPCPRKKSTVWASRGCRGRTPGAHLVREHVHIMIAAFQPAAELLHGLSCFRPIRSRWAEGLIWDHGRVRVVRRCFDSSCPRQKTDVAIRPQEFAARPRRFGFPDASRVRSRADGALPQAMSNQRHHGHPGVLDNRHPPIGIRSPHGVATISATHHARRRYSSWATVPGSC